MFRRAVLAAAVLMVLTTTSVLGATKTVSIYATKYSPATIKIAMGGTIKWSNLTAKSHTVASNSSFLATSFFKTTTVPAHGTASLVFPQAGSFPYHDTGNGMQGKVNVPMKVDMAFISLNDSVILTLGTVSASTGGQPDYHIVQASKNGGSTWTQIITTQSTAATWKPTATGTWIVRTCMHHALSGANSGWSPTLTVTVS